MGAPNLTVEEMARLSKRVAACCSTDEVANVVLESFIPGERRNKAAASFWPPQRGTWEPRRN